MHSQPWMCAVVSMSTWVEFTTAAASKPGAKRNSRAASVLISETMRCGPHWISTPEVVSKCCGTAARPSGNGKLPLPRDQQDGQAQVRSHEVGMRRSKPLPPRR
jgi:hypothetical protein